MPGLSDETDFDDMHAFASEELHPDRRLSIVAVEELMSVGELCCYHATVQYACTG